MEFDSNTTNKSRVSRRVPKLTNKISHASYKVSDGSQFVTFGGDGLATFSEITPPVGPKYCQLTITLNIPIDEEKQIVERPNGRIT